MDRMKKILLIIFSLSLLVAEAQDKMTIDEAIEIALKNNYDIQISKKDVEIAKTNNTSGNAGMLPDIGISGSGSYALKNVNQKVTGGSEVNYSGLGTTNLGAGAELSWTIFDGGKMFIAKSRLNEVEAMGELKFREQLLRTLSEVITSYYNVVKQKQQLNSIRQTIEFNLERVKIAQAGFNSGSLKKTDLLQAKIDLNVNKENAINQEYAILNAKRELAKLLSMSVDEQIEVSDSIEIKYEPVREELYSKLYKNNINLQIFEKQVGIEKLYLKESYRSQLPRVNFNGGYYFSGSTNNQGAILSNRSFGPQIGGNINIPVFQSGDLRRQINLSKIGIEKAEFNLESLKLETGTELLNSLTQFENNKELLEIEKDNYQLAKENLEISLQRMRLGEATSLEVRLAQQDFEQSATRLINFLYNLKIAETRLKQLTGDL